MDGAVGAGQGGEEVRLLLGGCDDPCAGAAEGLLGFENEGDVVVGDGRDYFVALGGEPLVSGTGAVGGDGGDLVRGERGFG